MCGCAALGVCVCGAVGGRCHSHWAVGRRCRSHRAVGRRDAQPIVLDLQPAGILEEVLVEELLLPLDVHVDLAVISRGGERVEAGSELRAQQGVERGDQIGLGGCKIVHLIWIRMHVEELGIVPTKRRVEAVAECNVLVAAEDEAEGAGVAHVGVVCQTNEQGAVIPQSRHTHGWRCGLPSTAGVRAGVWDLECVGPACGS